MTKKENIMSDKKKEHLWALRHSAEHVMHQAIKELYPQVLLAMGPATDEGFYNDFDSSPAGVQAVTMTEEDFPKIEKRMQILIDLDLPIIKKEISENEARKLFKGNPYKLGWIDEITKKGEKITVYWTGKPGAKNSMVDLCSGPHLASTGEIKAFKLLSVAGAYWHGDEKNKMLTRIYGTAFENNKQLEHFLWVQKEAKKRDHRKLGVDLDLFTFSDLVGKGLPMLTSKGATIRRELERFVIDEELKRGYQHVITPPLAKTALYKTSGHYPYYKNTMYPVMKVDDDELILRPMTCPHHFMLYKSRPHSYRELPLRYAELAPQFRYEKSGELSGLMRVRMFCLADAHIFVEANKVKSEIKKVLELIDYMNRVLGLIKGVDYRYRLSLGDRADKKKYYKDDAAWDKAESILREVLHESDAPFFEASGEAAFYGPKIDIQVRKFNGAEETAFTVQYDFVMPKRFALRYIDGDGQEQEPIVIHRSSIGAFERTMAFLIEKYAGAFPVWLSPIQAVVIPIAERHVKYANSVAEFLMKDDIRVTVDARNEKMQSKIRDAQLQKIPYMLIVGDREQKEKGLAVRLRTGQDLGLMPFQKFVQVIREKIDKKTIDL